MALSILAASTARLRLFSQRLFEDTHGVVNGAKSHSPKFGLS